MVLPRVLTALVLAPLFLWVLYLGSLPFFAFMALLTGLALWEFLRMAEQGGHATQGLWGWGVGMAAGVTLIFPGVRTAWPFHGQAPALALMAAAAALTIRELARRDKGLSMLRLAMSAAGILFIVWPLGYFTLLRDLRGESPALFHAGRNAAFLLVALIWAQDTAAWAVGMAVGKHRLAPAVSPKKSWEGAAGGLAAALIAGLVLREALLKDLFGRGEVLALAAVLGVLAQASDLVESLFKRCFGVKDSSALLPGHGGVLDRFDSFLLSAPFLYFYLVSVGKVAG